MRSVDDPGSIIRDALTNDKQRDSKEEKCIGRFDICLIKCSPTCIVEGIIATDMTAKFKTAAIEQKLPLGRLGQPHEIASMVSFLADKGTYITGQDIMVDGGLDMKF